MLPEISTKMSISRLKKALFWSLLGCISGLMKKQLLLFQDLFARLIGITGNCYNWELTGRSGATCTLPPTRSRWIHYR